jgi:hypothetical protein
VRKRKKLVGAIDSEKYSMLFCFYNTYEDERINRETDNTQDGQKRAPEDIFPILR